MKIAIVKDNRSKLASIASTYDQVVIKDQSEFWVTLEVTLHLNNTIDGTVNDETIWVK